MISCKSCKFSVTKEMRFALMKNICPGCGKALFGDSELQEISEIKSKVSGQDFALGLSEQVIHDMSLFIFREIESLILKQPKEEIIEVEETESQEDIAAKIREEVENEISDQIEALNPSDEDVDRKVARLKGVYKDSKIKRSGVIVSRVSSEEL